MVGGMQNADGAAGEVLSELADLRDVPLQEMPDGALIAVDKAVQRVIAGPAEAAVSARTSDSVI